MGSPLWQRGVRGDFIKISDSIGVKKEKVLRIEEHFQLAFGAAERGNLEEAIKEYKKVLKLDSKHAKAHLNLGGIYGRQGKWKEGDLRI
jgi:tetratricopeptide (TPR) repeat protein